LNIPLAFIWSILASGDPDKLTMLGMSLGETAISGFACPDQAFGRGPKAFKILRQNHVRVKDVTVTSLQQNMLRRIVISWNSRPNKTARPEPEKPLKQD
jgi:hypothetical protein